MSGDLSTESEALPEIGATAVCRTCRQPIWWEEGEIGHRKRLGWSDRIKRGGDSVVCFKARDYRHVPLPKARPCEGRNSNVCAAEGCYGEVCVGGGRP